MNWGYKILVVYGVFVMGILFLVIKSSSQKMDLVTTDYYAKELKYQQKIDEAGRANALSEPVQYTIKNNRFELRFPKDLAGKTISGHAELYYPADEDKDIKQDFVVKDSALVMLIPAGSRGLHELHISWQADGTSYYFEKKIFL